MAKTESLLQELVDLKRKEMRRTRVHRIVTFLFATLPIFTLIGLSIWGSILLFQRGDELIQDLPGIMNNVMDEQKEGFFEDIQDSISY